MNKYSILFASLLVIILLFIFATSKNTQNKNQTEASSLNDEPKNQLTNAITNLDIEESKHAISSYFNNLETSDTIILKDYLGYNMVNLSQIGACNVNSDNSSLSFLYDDNFKPSLIKIDTTSKHPFYVTDYYNEIKNQQGIDAYKIMNLHVYFNYLKDRDWDFVLVKYNENSPWKIHTWIE